MMYQVNVTHCKSGVTRNFNYWLDFQPSEITKIKAFANGLNALMQGKAIVTEIKGIIFDAEKPTLIDINYTSKVMYEINGGGLTNCSIPYLDRTIKQSEIEAFMAQHFQNFRKVNNVVHKIIV